MSRRGGFPAAARTALDDAQLRRNLRDATTRIRRRRLDAVGEVAEWEDLREAAAAVKREAMASLDVLLERLEERVTAAGGRVHWARDAPEARRIVADVVRATGAPEVLKVKSLLTDELELNAALEAAGVGVLETDLAELIVQLAGDRQSHILVPAIHRNRAEIRALFERTITGGRPLSWEPEALTAAARAFLRERFLGARVAVSGANFAVAKTGTIAVVESEGNGRMCLTLPDVLVTVMGIEKVLPSWEDLELFLTLLPRSSTGERMNPYTSLWTGVHPDDGPEQFHLVLVDAGRTATLADEVGREALHCIRCSACLNVCPVYARTGGHAYDSIYPGPIGAILTPQLAGFERGVDLPFASTLCGACLDACPVKIDIPRALVHLRARAAREGHTGAGERAALDLAGRVLGSRRQYELAQRLARAGRGPGLRVATALPGLRAWSRTRELPAVPDQSFREWWRAR